MEWRAVVDFFPSSKGMWFAINVLPLMDWNPRKPKSSPDQSSRPERWAADPGADEIASVRLIRKYADILDGVNLQTAKVGDRLNLPRRDAEVLIAEGWAERAEERRVGLLPRRSIAADSRRRPQKKRKK
jgi:hypothetical protein